LLLLLLLQDVTKRAALQPLLVAEADHLQWVYDAALYGRVGDVPAAAIAQGDDDFGTGALFVEPA
jgi:hypothetical protein